MKKLTVQSGPIVRTRKMERHYVLHRKQLTHDGCDFCDFAPLLASLWWYYKISASPAHTLDKNRK